MFLGAVPATLFHPVKWRSSVYSGWPMKTCSSQTIDALYSNAQVWHQEHHSQYAKYHYSSAVNITVLALLIELSQRCL